ncbi:MAG: HD domain-containing protein [Syntrophobacterales bacterium]|jgi:HD-GYP domain-containing protein (c-di-GMP phosphodiesterase class II)|nr:HD domain-containing protein [Syntrophobacterales bacterium]
MVRKKDKITAGEDFLQSFFKLSQISKLYRFDNQLFLDNAAEFLKATNDINDMDGYVNLRLFRGRFYLNEERFTHHPSVLHAVNQLAELFQKCDIPGFRMQNTKLISPAEVITFFTLLNKAEHMDDPGAWLQLQLEDDQYLWVEMLSDQDFAVTSRKPELEKIARGTYSTALTTIMALTGKLYSQKRVGIQKSKRVIQDMIEILLEDEAALLGMSTIRNYDDYTYTHSINVAILCLCLGQRIGLARNLVEQLGLCGLFHDLGKVDIPLELITKETPLTNEEYEEIKNHPLNSVQQIIKLNANHALKAKLLLPPFEHHLGVDLSGYPQSDRKAPLSLMGRILAIADQYDALTSSRAYRPTPISPDQAMGLMMRDAGTKLDVLLLKVFINMVGIYPIGTVLVLDRNEMGMVLRTAENSESGRPIICLLQKNQDGKFEKGETVDLSKRNPQTKEFYRDIIASFHPSEYNIQPADFLLGFGLDKAV